MLAAMLGWSARRLLCELPTLAPEVAAITVTTYPPVSETAVRLGQGISIRGVQAREREEIVREALRHRGFVEPVVEIPVEELESTLLADPPANRVRALCSRVRLRSGAVANLPLVDFSCEVTDVAAAMVVAAMAQLGETHGALLESGRSFHYYGLAPRSDASWRRFMSFALLLAPLVDARHAAHGLIEDLGCLRLDAHPMQPVEPRVVRWLHEPYSRTNVAT
jgi:hypothetical protein